MAKFKPGHSGNPNGRPKLAEEFRRKCQELTPEVLKAWLGEIEEKDRPMNISGKWIKMKSRGKEWLRASENIAAYGLGKPAQPVTGENGEGDVPVSITVRFVGADSGKTNA